MAITTIPILRHCCGSDCAATIASTKFDDQQVEQRASALQALGDETRLKMVQLLARHDSLCVCEIQEAFELGQPTVSHHLKILREAGLIDSQRRGKWAYYALRREALHDVAQHIQSLI
ncbi:MAG TPA: metalloregulator ArsR/SmtB family transcription factor [bacterium]|jgi:ArsR family transcriptional regulator